MMGVLDPRVCFHSLIFRAEMNLLILSVSVQIAMAKTIDLRRLCLVIQYNVEKILCYVVFFVDKIHLLPHKFECMQQKVYMNMI